MTHTVARTMKTVASHPTMALLFSTFFSMGCGVDAERGSKENAQIYAMGDSLFEWNLEEGQSAPDAIANHLNQPVYNAAISGAMMTDESEMGIPKQYENGNWSWVVIEGGGNDLNDLCDCGECEDVQNEIESKLRDFVSNRREEGVSVLIWGYYGLPEGAEFGFDRCEEELNELSSRQSALAETDDDIVFVDGRLIITGENLDAFDEDKVHPSPAGSALVGEQIAEAIRNHSNDSED